MKPSTAQQCEPGEGDSPIAERLGPEGGAVVDSLSRIVSAAPHELIGPLNQVSSLVALFAKRHANIAGNEAATLLSLAESSAERMQSLVEGLRTWFEIAGANRLRVPVDMEEALRVALYLLDADIRRLDAVVSCDPLPKACGDPDCLAQLFRILVGNALKFHKPDVRPEIRITAKPSQGKNVFSVADNGVGFDPAYTDQVFLPFKKLNGQSCPGAGMGLAVAKMIVDLHLGSISIDSQPSRGTTVFFALSAPPNP